MRVPRLLRVAAATVVLVLLATGSAYAEGTGPDVSSWQHTSGPIDWTAVHDGGNAFTFIKATEGSSYTNGYFASDWAASTAAGLYRGAYHYARPSVGSAADQAAFFASTIGSQTSAGILPPVLDMEEAGSLSPDQLIDWTSTFLTTVQALTGRQPMIYTYPYFWRTKMAGSLAFTGYPLWIASYGTVSPPTLGWPSWTFWQYSATSSVSGIAGNAIDMSRFVGDAAQLAALAGSGPPVDPSLDPTGITDPGPAVIASPSRSRYVPVNPVRFADSRSGLGMPAGPATGTVTVTLPDAVPTNATGVVLNASVVAPSAAGYLRAAPAGSTPVATALNYARNQSVTGLVVTSADAARQTTVTLYGGAGQLVLDLVGYYTPAPGAGGHWVPLNPSRIVDTRLAQGANGPQQGDVTFALADSVPKDAAGAVLNVSVVEPAASGFLRISPTGTVPTTTALNYQASRSSTGLVMTKTNNGSVTVSLHGGAGQVVVDLVGFYDGTSENGQAFVAVAPQRFLDTRTGLGAAGRHVHAVTLTLPDSVPADATGAVLNLSAVAPGGKGFLRVAAVGETPATTALSFDTGQSTTGLALTPIGAGRQITVTLYGAAVDVVADLVGFHTAAG